MPTIKETARITAQSGGVRLTGGATGDLPDTSTAAAIENCAALVHWRMVELAQKEGVPMRHPLTGEPGYRWEGSRRGVLVYLWPGLDEAPRTPGKMNPMQAIEQTITKYLNHRGNTWCVTRGNVRRMSVWWVRHAFLPGSATYRQEKDYTEAQRARKIAEAKLTPHEAGEDRTPAPVTVTHTPASAQPAGARNSGSPVRSASPAREHYGLRRKSAGAPGAHTFDEVTDMHLAPLPNGRERVFVRRDDGKVYIATITDLEL